MAAIRLRFAPLQLRVAALAAASAFVLSLAALPAPSAAQTGRGAAAPPSGDEAILAAADAFRRRDRARLAAAAPGARGHVLEPYVQYWQLTIDLPETPAEQLREFLARHPRSFMAERLRADFIRDAGRRGDWAKVRAEHRQLAGDAETDVACWVLQARWREGDAAAPVEAMPIWSQQRNWPEACTPLFEHLIRSGELTQRNVWLRARNLLEAGQTSAAQRTLDYLPEAEQPDPKLLAGVVTAPAKFIDRARAQMQRRAGRELTMVAIARMARNDPADALLTFDPNTQARLLPDERAWVFGQLGLHGARRHRSEALAWFLQSADAELGEEHHAWRVRAALREQNWPQVRSAIERMPQAMRPDPTWVYWHGRALREAGLHEESQAAFVRIAARHDFYGKLAAEELGQRAVLPPRGHAPTPEELQALQREPAIQRALALFRLDLRSEGVREWNWAIRSMTDQQLIAAAEIARRAEIWDRAINTAERTVAVHDFDLRFLAPYRPIFTQQAKALGIEESWALGITRQESRFINYARSHAGASGLMQLMPGTARLVAKRIGMREFRWSEVTDPQVNITLGTQYMRDMLDSLESSALLASAAYNAGPGRAQRWRANRPLEGAIYAETIPFNETRDYVKRVLSNTVYYSLLLSGESRPLKARLGVIPPRQGGAEEETASAAPYLPGPGEGAATRAASPAVSPGPMPAPAPAASPVAAPVAGPAPAAAPAIASPAPVR